MHPSKPYRLSLAALAGLVGLSAVTTAGLAVLNPAGPAWFMLGFELCVLLATVFGVLTALGRFQQGVAMIWICIAGCVAVASFVGALSAGRKLFDIGLEPWVAARFAAAGVFVLAALFEATRAQAGRAWPLLLKGASCLLPVLVVAAALYRGWGTAQLANLNGLVRILILGVGFVLFGALLAAGIHLTLKAFEIGLSRKPQGSRVG